MVLVHSSTMRRSAPIAFFAALVAAVALLLAAPAAGVAAQRSPALPDGKIEALLQLRHPRGLNRFVRRVSDPRSPRYRHYSTVEKLVARYGAKPKTRKRVLRWLRAHGLHGTVTAAGTFVLVPLPAAKARPQHGAVGAASAVLSERRVPAALQGAVVGVSVLDPGQTRASAATAAGDGSATAAASKKKRKFPYFSIRAHTGTAGGCAAGSSAVAAPGLEPFTPNQYLTAYGLAAMHARGFKGQGRVVAIVEGGGFRRSDIHRFARCFGFRAPPIQIVQTVPAKYLQPEEEPTLDVSMVAAAAPGLKRIIAYEGGGSLENIIETTGAAIGSPGHRPDVMSISYGECEATLAEAQPYREALDNILAVAAGAGISVLASAGDQGSSGCRAYSHEPGTPKETALPFLAVEIPSASAYATAVGGTNLVLSKKNRIKNQIVWNDWPEEAAGGGGGISLLYAHTPWWQSGLSHFRLGRKVPDIAALGDPYPGYALYCTAAECEPGKQVVRGWTSIGGTSAATPLMAAGVAIADQYAARHGQRPLGFLNPLLYQLGADRKTRRGAFDDVVTGNNDVGRILPANVGGGFPLGCCSARSGYDTASGWGSLKMPGFAKLAVGAGR